MLQELPFVGRTEEIHRLTAAARERRPLVILGAAGIGKTRLIREALPPGAALYVKGATSLHGLLVGMSRSLIAARHGAFLDRAKPGADTEAWLAAQTSVHLKGLLWNALEASPAVMVLDGIAGAGFPTYRFLQRIYHAPGMTLLATARDAAGLGALSRLFWNPAGILNLPPLHERDAAGIFEAAADHFQLRHLDLDDFRHKVLASANGNPGQIIEMCRLATQPQYVSGRYVKFSPLRIDTVIRFGA